MPLDGEDRRAVDGGGEGFDEVIFRQGFDRKALAQPIDALIVHGIHHGGLNPEGALQNTASHQFDRMDMIEHGLEGDILGSVVINEIGA